MNLFRLILIQVFLLISMQVNAQEDSNDFTVYGLGSISCGKYSSFEQNSTDLSSANQWVLGFVTGKNESLHFENSAAKASYLDGLDFYAITKFVKIYCDKNPLDPLYSAANKLVYELWERSQK